MTDSTIVIADEIIKKINELEAYKSELDDAVGVEPRAIADADLEVAKVTIGLRSGKEFVLEGQTISNPPVSLTEQIVKAICWQKLLDLAVAKRRIKAIETKINICSAQLNGFQSIYKHQSEI